MGADRPAPYSYWAALSHLMITTGEVTNCGAIQVEDHNENIRVAKQSKDRRQHIDLLAVILDAFVRYQSAGRCDVDPESCG